LNRVHFGTAQPVRLSVVADEIMRAPARVSPAASCQPMKRGFTGLEASSPAFL